MLTLQELHQISKPKFEREFNPTETMRILLSNTMTFFSWGVSKRYNFDDKGLLLKVSGNHHKGWVLITLSYMDLYNVFLISNKGEIIESIEGLYFDQLTESIDRRIERIPEYKR